MSTKYDTGLTQWSHGEEMRGDWHRLLGPCPLCGSPTFNYGGGWRCLAQYCNNNASNPAPSVGSAPEWWNTGIQVKKDGDMWMAHREDFINITESDCEFAPTPNEAVKKLLKTA